MGSSKLNAKWPTLSYYCWSWWPFWPWPQPNATTTGSITTTATTTGSTTTTVTTATTTVGHSLITTETTTVGPSTTVPPNLPTETQSSTGRDSEPHPPMLEIGVAMKSILDVMELCVCLWLIFAPEGSKNPVISPSVANPIGFHGPVTKPI